MSTLRTRLLQCGALIGIAVALAPIALIGSVWSAAVLRSPAPSLLLLDRRGRFLGEIGDHEDFGYWPVEALPGRVIQATVAIEDRRFWRHPGVDPVAVTRALYQNISNQERISGASTLAMQIARMQAPGPRTYPRKAHETLVALTLTARYDRDEIARHYLRLAPYGNRIHGIRYAARRYLDKPVADLSWAEVAFLAALPQAPGRMNPYDPRGRERAVNRGRQILELLRADGLLAEDALELALTEIANLTMPPRSRRPESALHAVLRLDQFIGKRKRALEATPILRTSLDLQLQEDIVWRSFLSLEAWKAKGAGNAAVMVLDRSTSEVLAYVGSTDYFDQDSAGSIDYAQVPRSPGSTLKPFFYAQALDRGEITPATTLDDLRRGPQGIGNADERFLGPLLPRVALANSRNVPAIEVLNRIGVDEGYAFLGELGLHDFTRNADHYGLGLAIGSMPVTLEDLITGYTALATDGRIRSPRWYDKQPHDTPRRVLSEQTARQISLFLSDPMARLPTFPRMGASEFPFAVAIKTGTSQNVRDAWAIAYSGDYIVGVWIGHPDYTPMRDLGGFRSAAVLVHQVLEGLHGVDNDGLSNLAFPPPREHEGVRLCSLTGRLATPACNHVSLEWLGAADVPTESCETHVRLAVDVRNGLRATARTAREHTQVQTFTMMQPTYAAWAADHGLLAPPRAVSPFVDEQNGVRIQFEPDSAPSQTVVAARTETRVRVVSPRTNAHFLRDPETPPGLATIALEAVVDPPSAQVVWYVDGKPFEVAEHPYTVRWPLEPGVHSFVARVPYSDFASAPVRVRVGY